MAIDPRRGRPDGGHWVRHDTPAGTGTRPNRAMLLIDIALFLIAFGALVGFAISLGAWGSLAGDG